jgi:ADP-ribose pyrophosphatase
VKRKTLFEGKILQLDILDDKWEVVRHQAAVAILALKDHKVLGVEQYRPAIGQRTWELPAGLIDEGESPLEAAQRELAEETQLTGKLELISQFYTSPGFTTEKLYLYRATDLTFADGTPDEDEDLHITWRAAASLWEAIKTGKLASSSPSVLGLHVALNS